jgi:glycosyltransferase involved in cell wall biosynthesis
MNLGINLVPLFPGKIGGGEQYIRNLILCFQRRKNVRLFLYLNPEAIATFHEAENITLAVVYMDQNIEAQLAHFIDLHLIDVWFCPLFHLVPPQCPVPSVVTIFDIQQEFFPQYFEKSVLKNRKAMTRNTVTGADSIITISEFSKKTIGQKLAVPAEKIHVTWLDSDMVFAERISSARLEAVRAKYKLPREYIFYPANTWPHKNHRNLILAYAALVKEKNLTARLVFTGARHGAHDEIEYLIRKESLEDHLLYLGYIDQADMPAIYAGAQVLAFPSLFEGFGIPVVEAMRAGIPVACATAGSLPEIGGDAVCYFDPLSVADIAARLWTVLTEAEYRERLIAGGRERSTLFSWDRCAAETMDIFYAQAAKVKKMPALEPCPLVSIITPSYNQGIFIRETIESVLTQSYPYIEYIVVDGGSADDTPDILRSYGDRIIWVSEKDKGQADAVNKGLKMAKGEIIGWLNSDDTYLPEAVQKAVDYLQKRSWIDMVYGEGYYTDKDGQITDRYETERFDRERLAETCYICQPTAFFRRAAAERVGWLDERLQLCMDYELWIKIALTGRIAYLPEYLATSRLYEENKTMSRKGEVYREVCATVKKHFGYVPLNWLYGYAMFENRNKGGWKYRFKVLRLFIRQNWDNPRYYLPELARKLYHKMWKKKELPYTGRYNDDWLSGEYITCIQHDDAIEGVELKGRHLWPLADDLEIDVHLDNTKIGKLRVREKGEFQCRMLCLPLQSGQHTVRLVMNSTFSPLEHRLSGDARRLSFILDELRVL